MVDRRLRATLRSPLCRFHFIPLLSPSVPGYGTRNIPSLPRPPRNAHLAVSKFTQTDAWRDPWAPSSESQCGLYGPEEILVSLMSPLSHLSIQDQRGRGISGLACDMKRLFGRMSVDRQEGPLCQGNAHSGQPRIHHSMGTG